jgi:hypothetical protein
MVSPNDFWLQLHRLAEAYDAEGITSDERAHNIVQQFRELAHPARRELLAELLQITVHLPDVYPLVMAAANDDQHSTKTRGREGAA